MILEGIGKDIHAVFVSLPCATWSRARRGKRIPGKKNHWPLPLRDGSKEGIFGITANMSVKDATRVKASFLQQALAKPIYFTTDPVAPHSVSHKAWGQSLLCQDANAMANWVAELVATCEREGTLLILENPSGSWLWKYPAIMELLPPACSPCLLSIHSQTADLSDLSLFLQSKVLRTGRLL